MGRRLRTTLPQTTKHWIPQWPYLSYFRRADQLYKGKTKEDFDRRHRVHDLPEIPDDHDVWVSTDGDAVPGTVISPAGSPRSYVVQTPTGEIRRNQHQLLVRPEANQQTEQSELRPRTSPIKTRSRTGVILRHPERLT